MITDSILTARAKRLALVITARTRRLALKLLPFMIAFFLGVMWGERLEDQRIHQDCKFMGTFRIDYTGYLCKLGKE